MICTMGLSGCGQTKSSHSSAASSSTKLVMHKYTTAQLQSRYDQICNLTVRPLLKLVYGTSVDDLKPTLKRNQTKLEHLALELKNNSSNTATTQALSGYVTDAEAVLKAVSDNNQTEFNAATKKFFKKSSNIAKSNFSGHTPQSLITYSQAVQSAAKANSSSSSSSSSSTTSSSSSTTSSSSHSSK
ncbi:hypothetical protein [Lacticaseibacillus thailandensis]|uniref:hypothetical protein n=1 Tax=Lacticaseibacillus thailandensis TaxID=381741 RepID=UPI0012E23137|nr:hypothetical protein [Lacticaseibacillus thailandensis]